MVDKKYNVLTTEGYFQRFFFHLQNGCGNHPEAYNKLEEERMYLGAPRKYGDYLSFKRGKSYHLKNKGRLK